MENKDVASWTLETNVKQEQWDITPSAEYNDTHQLSESNGAEIKKLKRRAAHAGEDRNANARLEEAYNTHS